MKRKNRMNETALKDIDQKPDDGRLIPDIKTLLEIKIRN